MADVITRFKLETTQYDSKLRDEAKRLADFSRQASIAGSEFGKFAQKNVEAARAFGNIATSATNAKDKVKELVGAFNDVAKQYNTLTKEQQQSDFGKALAQSMQQLKTRITEAKQELYGLGDAMDSIKKSGLFGENGLTGMLAVAGGNLLATGLQKLGSEMADTVQQSIELARQGEGVRIAFERLNQPGLLDKLKEATHGTVSEIELMKQAIQFENFKLPLEDLATYLAFAQQKAKDTGQSIDYLVNSIVTGLGRQSKQILDNLGISAAELTRRMNEGADMTKAVADIIREEMDKAGGYFETAADRAARAAAEASNRMEELGRKAIPVAEMWTETWNTLKTGGMEFLNFVLTPLAESLGEINNLLDNGAIDWDKVTSNPNNAVGPNVDENGNFIRRPSDGNWAGYDAYNGRYYNQIDSIGEITVTGKKPKKKPGRSGSAVKKPTATDFSTFLAKSTLNADKFKPEDIISPPSVWEQYGKDIAGSIETINDSMSNLSVEGFAESYNQVEENVKKMNEALAQQQMAFSMAGQAATNFGAALAGLDDPAAKAAGTVISAIANIALGFGQAVAQAGSMGPWAWLAYVAAGTAALATTISTVHSLTGYASGGEIKGNSYSGDNIPIMANAGEIILNRAQQANVAQGLQGGTPGNINLQAVASGEQLWFVINNHTKRKGWGEIVTWR